ncbi:MAG: SoxR reducing system RseC family protein [Clostridia bacterium]|nr:SoxR reducing system RseC family protein [Clostridia bacterium]
MERIETCTVQKRKRNLYYIRLTKNAKCEGCKACAFGKKNALIVPALSEIDCAAGDSVAVSMPEKRVKASYVYLYLLPLACMFIGLMIPYGHGESYMFLGAMAGIAVSVPAVYLIERMFRRRKKYLPVIVRKISQKENEI